MYSGSDYTQPDPGYPQVAGPDFWGVPPECRGAEPFPVAVLFDRENTLFLGATQYVSHNATSGAWSYPRPLARLWPGVPLGTASAPLRSAFTVVPPYLEDASAGDGETDFADLGIQLTRATRALKVWLSVRAFGLGAFRAAIDRSLDLAARAAEQLAALESGET